MFDHPMWAVAAAILLKEKYGPGIHISVLTKKVQESGLSGLGRDGKTPERTLEANLLRKKHGGVHIFSSNNGYYELDDPKSAERISKVEYASTALNRIGK